MRLRLLVSLVVTLAALAAPSGAQAYFGNDPVSVEPTCIPAFDTPFRAQTQGVFFGFFVNLDEFGGGPPVVVSDAVFTPSTPGGFFGDWSATVRIAAPVPARVHVVLVSTGGGPVAQRTLGGASLQVGGCGQPDTTPPVLGVPEAVSIDAEGPGGVIVYYRVTATDNADPRPVVVCVPPSGASFPIGTSTVSCSATDAAGNSATATFTVLARGADEQLARLRDHVESLGMGGGLSAELRVASRLLERGNARAACAVLSAFRRQAKRRGADIFVLEPATRIRHVLACDVGGAH